MSEHLTCHEGVTRQGEFQPCDRPAVAYRLDITEDNLPYPVCVGHTRHPMQNITARDRAENQEELEYLQGVEQRLAELLCSLTGGKLSKTNYPVSVMEQQIDQYMQECIERDHAAEIAAAKSEALREAAESVLDTGIADTVSLSDWLDRRADEIERTTDER